ncbi:uncharacterized protein LOC134182067 isoform X1 [Corticium candelabrum]|uniref:uncharacterized protein LOC134182067 isoform X1 n=2 Tax=Corticium candelabrum TaxID=121492 RepID=UPI002E276BCF|nr:uncharacterized protein LOC134182067 isoform X1 [Corticium candelabrum]
MDFVLPSWLVYSSIALLIIVISLAKVLVEAVVLWMVAMGGTKKQRSMKRNLRIHSYVCQTHLLDAVSTTELFLLCKNMLSVKESSSMSVETFHKYLLKYSHVAIFRDRLDGSLRGMFMIDYKTNLSMDGRSYNCINLGMTWFRNNYRGGPLMYAVLGFHFLYALFRHPFTPLIAVGKVYSAKLYTATARAMKQVYPRHDVETPHWIKRVMDHHGKMLTEGDNGEYDPLTGVIKQDRSMLQDHASADAGGHIMDNPHAKYFCKVNPDWKKGHCLLILAPVTWGTLFSLFVSSVKRFVQLKGSLSSRRQLHNRNSSKPLLTRFASSHDLRMRRLNAVARQHSLLENMDQLNEEEEESEATENTETRHVYKGNEKHWNGKYVDQSQEHNELMNEKQIRKQKLLKRQSTIINSNDEGQLNAAEVWKSHPRGARYLVYRSPSEMAFDTMDVSSLI